MENDFYKNAINSLIPNAKGHFRSGHELAKDNSIIEWYDERTKPTVSAIQTEMTRLQAEYVTLEYARNRKAEYDALNQFELISDDTINGTTTHKDAVEAVKTKWPKDNSGPVE
jgi:hypothetical protein